MAFIRARELAKKMVRRQSTLDEVWDFLLLYFETNRVGPTLKEICQAIDVVQGKKPGTSSKSLASAHLNTLERRGLIERPKLEQGGRGAAKIIVVNSKWRYNG